MQKKVYHSFTAIDGTKFRFSDYMSFSLWYFSHSRRVVKLAFDEKTFRDIEFAATKSAEAKRKIA